MLIGIIGAMEIEVKGLTAAMDHPEVEMISSIKYYKGKLHGCECVIAQAGVGKVNAAICAQTMILRYAPDAIINIGVAGGLDPELNTGDIAIADRVAEHDMDTTPLGDAPGFITGLDRVYMDCDQKLAESLYEAACKTAVHTVKKGVIASGDQFIASDKQRRQIIEHFGAIAAEMEGASIGHVCTMNRIPFGVMRAISDNADGSSTMDFPAFAELAAKNSIEIVFNLLKELA